MGAGGTGGGGGTGAGNKSGIGGHQGNAGVPGTNIGGPGGTYGDRASSASRSGYRPAKQESDRYTGTQRRSTEAK